MLVAVGDYQDPTYGQNFGNPNTYTVDVYSPNNVWYKGFLTVQSGKIEVWYLKGDAVWKGLYVDMLNVGWKIERRWPYYNGGNKKYITYKGHRYVIRQSDKSAPYIQSEKYGKVLVSKIAKNHHA